MSEPVSLIAEMRRFNRFYTRTIGVLEETSDASPFTLTEARVLFELGHRARPAEPDMPGERGFLARGLHLNIGPAASEIASGAASRPGLSHAHPREIRRRRPDRGARRRGGSAPADPVADRHGEAALADLQAAADRDVARLIEPIAPQARRRLAGAMQAIEATLAPHTSCPKKRRPRSSSGRIASATSAGSSTASPGSTPRNMAGTANTRRWSPRSARLSSATSSPARNSAGSPRWTARLPEPSFSCANPTRWGNCACCMSSGTRAVSASAGRWSSQCVDTARQAGYRRLVLWTNDVLADARRLYERAGFLLVAQEPHHSFGKDLVGQTWELGL